MHVVLHSYSLRDHPREHVFAVARRQGWTHVELAACHLDTAADLARALAQAREAGTTVHCVGYWGQFAEQGATRRASIERTLALVDACAAEGVGLLNGSGGWLVADPARWQDDWRVNGSALATSTDLRRVADAYRALADHAAPRGVRINIEIHPNTVHDTAAATARLLDLIDRDGVGVTLDPSNAAALSEADRDPGVLDLLGARADYFHLKNCTVRGGVADFSTDADQGVIDNDRWLAALAGCPAVAVEYCGDGDPHPRLAAARGYLEAAIRTLATAGAP